MSGRPSVLRLGLVLCATVYVLTVGWIFTRTSPVGGTRNITIRIAHWQIEKGPPEGIEAVIKRYEELNPRVRVVQMLVPSGVYRQWMRANFAGDNAPDIVQFGAWLDGLTDLPVRYFAPLTDFLLEPNPYNAGTPLEGVPWLKTFEDELLEQRLNSPEPGQYYAVTLSRGAFRLFTNRNLLREITGSNEAPADFAALRRLFAQTAEYGHRRGRPVYPFASSQNNAIWLMAFYMGGVINALGPRLDRDGLLGLYNRQLQWGYLRGDWRYDQPEVKAGLQLVGELAAQMKPGFIQFRRDEAVRQFLQGDALFLFAGVWEATTLRRLADFPVDALRCPQPTKDDPVVGGQMLGRFADGNNMTGFGLYLNKSSPHPKEAVDFLRFLTSYEGAGIFSRHCGWPPSVRFVPVAPEVADLVYTDDGYAYNGPSISVGGSTGYVFARNLHILTAPNGSVDQMAATLDREVRGSVREALQSEGRAAWLAVLPQDARIAALGVLAAPGNRLDPADVRLRRERIEAAQNLSEARAMLIDRQLAETADR